MTTALRRSVWPECKCYTIRLFIWKIFFIGRVFSTENCFPQGYLSTGQMGLRVDVRVMSTQKRQKTLKFWVLVLCQVPLETIMRVPRNKSLVRTREVFFCIRIVKRQKLQHIVRQTSLWMVNLLLASKLMLGWHIKIVVNGTIRRVMGTSPHSSHTLLGGRNWISIDARRALQIETTL